MHLSKKMEGEILVLTAETDRIDAASAIQVKDQFRDAVTDTGGRVVMDLRAVTFMDSSGLGAMVAVLKLLNGRKLELACLQPTVAKVFALTRMDKVFVLHEDLDAALAVGDGADAA